MSYFYKNRIYDAYVIDRTIYANDGDVFVNDFIEIFNNEEFVLDFTDISMICSNEKIKGTELHKIKVVWGDGHEDVLVKELGDGGSSLNVVFDSWKKVKHLFNHDKRSVYLSDDIASLPAINIYFYNTYNDIIRMVIPYKLVYKSLYDLNCRFDLVSGHTGNDYLTTFVLKEGSGDSMSVVQTINPILSTKNDEFEYITNVTSSTDYSNDFVDEDNVIWGWDQIPYVTINPSHTYKDGIRVLKVDCIERTVPVESWTPRVQKLFDSGNQIVETVKNDENGSFTFYVYGDDYDSIGNGLYQIDLDVLGINDVQGFTDAKFKAIPTNSDYTKTVSYGGSEDREIFYDFSVSKSVPKGTGDVQKDTGDVQWCYLKDAKLIFKPYEIDSSTDGLGTSGFVEADESFKFEFPLDLTKIDSSDNVKIEIPKKSLPNGNYNVWCVAEDLLGNKTDTTATDFVSKNVHDFSWRYSKIGEIECSNKTENDITVFSWNVKNAPEMDKIQFKLEYSEDGKQWEILHNEKKSHELWETETIGETESGKIYNYSFTLPHNQYSDGKYRATTSHVLDMNDFVGERKKEDTTDVIELIYNTPKVTINSINPTFQYNNTTKSWIPNVTFDLSFSKQDVSDFEMSLQYNDEKTKKISMTPSTTIIKTVTECFGDYRNFKASFTCRDSNDYFFRRVDKKPQTESMIKITDDYLKCHTSIPEFDEIVDTFGVYQDEDGNRVSGIDVISQSALDVYRNHRSGKYYKFIDGTKESNYFDDKISFFMTKKFTPISIDKETGEEVLENEKSFYRFVQADKFSNSGLTWTQLGTTADKFKNGIKTEQIYVPEIDKVKMIVGKDLSLDSYNDVIYSKVKLFKDNNLVYDNVAKDLSKGHEINDVELGDYRIEIDYSSLDTSTIDSNKVIKNVAVRANADDVISDVHLDSNSAGDGNYTITLSWKLNHKLATGLTLFMSDGSKTFSFENALNYDSYSPPFYFSSGEEVKCWFQMTSRYVNFGNGTTGEVFRDTFTV